MDGWIERGREKERAKREEKERKERDKEEK